MGRLLKLIALVALLALLPLAAHAQAEQPFEGVFDYTDRNGPGTLTITPLAGDSAEAGVQRIQAVLTQGSESFNGVGAYYTPGDDAASPALLSFALLDDAARSYYFQARIRGEGEGAVGEGTYFLVAEPQTEYSWSIEAKDTDTVPQPAAIESSLPALTGEWATVTLADAIGGLFYSTDNQAAAPIKRATWTGGLPAAGQYRVEAFIPAPQEGAAPRTENASYRLSGGLTDPQIVQVSQTVTTSGWVALGTFTFGTAYEIVLTDETGEPVATRSVVANALRFTPLSGTS